MGHPRGTGGASARHLRGARNNGSPASRRRESAATEPIDANYMSYKVGVSGNIGGGHGSRLAWTGVSENDLAFVRQTMRLLDDAGVRTWLFGGWIMTELILVRPETGPA